jgi:hypothetical protein
MYSRGPACMQHPSLGNAQPRGQAETPSLNGSARRCGITCLQQPPCGGHIHMQLQCCALDVQGSAESECLLLNSL